MDIRIESRPTTHYAFIRHVGPYSEIGPSFDRLFDWAGKGALIDPDTNCFTLSYDDPETVAAEALRSDACLSLKKEDIETTGEIKVGTISAGRYAVQRYVGSYDGISAAYQHMFTRWLPASGEAVAERPCMEIYLNNPETTPPDRLETLLCIPLKGQDTV